MTTQAELVRLEIPALPAFVGVARTVIVAIATSIEGIDDDRLEDLRIAVSEACTNAVEAHRSEEIEQRVVLRCLLDDEHLEIRIEDAGGGFDPDSLSTPRGEDPEGLRAERGWGIQLIRALVDDVTFNRSGNGTAVSLAMRLSPAGGDLG
ncbi:MAG TPA: ATP-binding protein [Acidimicrobiales bacterium]|nr:ATP-binding protein [Acidimicrobiales bacterium]